MLEVFDKQLKKIAILENALDIREEQTINAVSYFYYSLPYNDSKNRYCQPFHYVRYDGGDIYRIMPKTLRRSDTGLYEYQCEHAIATLMDKSLFGYHVVGNLGYYTNQVIQYVLDQQLVRNWTLGTCEFNRQFEYGWEQENLLSALFSIPQPFTELYRWEYDFNAYPWKISLKKIDQQALPSLYIRDRKNLQELEIVSDPTTICTRLYPLGYGEGVNQLNIASVNNGLPYIQSTKRYVDQYGIIERIWIDRRYEDVSSLYAAAQSMLNELQEPTVQQTVSFSEVGLSGFESVKLGNIVRIIDQETATDITTYIVGIRKNFDDIPSSQITIANKATDIASSIADLADRQRIEMAYAQGATNIYAQSLQGNADKKNGLKVNFYIPSEMRIINKVQAKIQIDSFRAYSKATEGGGGYFGTTEAGGGYYGTTEAGGGLLSTSSTELSAAYTSDPVDSDGFDNQTRGIAIEVDPHNHGVENGTGLKTEGDGTVWFAESGGHEHEVIMRNHRHIVNDLGHNHEVEMEPHTHGVELDTHIHDIEIEAHAHDIEPGIYEFGNPTAFQIYVNGRLCATVQDFGADVDLTGFLIQDGSIPRGTWHEVEIRPNDLAYISIDMFVQGFIQSRGDNTL